MAIRAALPCLPAKSRSSCLLNFTDIVFYAHSSDNRNSIMAGYDNPYGREHPDFSLSSSQRELPDSDFHSP